MLRNLENKASGKHGEIGNVRGTSVANLDDAWESGCFKDAENCGGASENGCSLVLRRQDGSSWLERRLKELFGGGHASKVEEAERSGSGHVDKQERKRRKSEMDSRSAATEARLRRETKK